MAPASARGRERRAVLAWACLSALAFAACREGEDPSRARAAATVVTEAASDDLIARGRSVAGELECVRCHVVPGIAPASPDKDCVGCHQRIEAGDFDAEPEVLDEWRDHIEHLTLTPDLGGATRLRRAWLEEFLRAPHDLRPRLEASMPRLDIDPDQAAALAAFLSPEAARAVAIEGDVAPGRAAIESHACASCHGFDRFAEPVAPRAVEPAAADAARLAPDLSLVRERIRPDLLVQWLENPQSVHAASPMPASGLTRDEAEDVAAFLLRAPLAPASPVEPLPRLPLLERPVEFAEVRERVFERTCWHCHSDPAFAPGGDGGPGNTGGLGFAGRGLDLSSLPAMSAGARDDAGERRSIFRKLRDGTPALVAHLDARRVEQAGGVVDGVRGMPLGLPALSREDIQLVETWIAQGRRE